MILFCNWSASTLPFMTDEDRWDKESMNVNVCTVIYQISLAKKSERGQTTCFHPWAPYDIAAAVHILIWFIAKKMNIATILSLAPFSLSVVIIISIFSFVVAILFVTSIVRYWFGLFGHRHILWHKYLREVDKTKEEAYLVTLFPSPPRQ